MSAVLFSELQRVIDYGFGSVRYLTTVNVKCQASFTITYGDRMWVGNTFSRTTGTLVGFRVKNVLGIPRLVRDGEIEMPILAQGAMLADIGDKTYLAISVSGGRVNPSIVHRYEIDMTKVEKGKVPRRHRRCILSLRAHPVPMPTSKATPVKPSSTASASAVSRTGSLKYSCLFAFAIAFRRKRPPIHLPSRTTQHLSVPLELPFPQASLRHSFRLRSPRFKREAKAN